MRAASDERVASRTVLCDERWQREAEALEEKRREEEYTLAMQEFWLGHNLAGFDGSVLEIFGHTHVFRHHLFHIQSLELKQRRNGTFSLSVYAEGGDGMAVLGDLKGSGLQAARALMDAIDAARQARGWPPVSKTH